MGGSGFGFAHPAGEAKPVASGFDKLTPRFFEWGSIIFLLIEFLGTDAD
jgi:hypothetical protein